MNAPLPLVQPAAVRRKVEAWLADPNDRAEAIALKTRPEWDGDPLLTIAGTTVRVVPCPTPLAARAALHDRAEGEKVVLLTPFTDAELGDGLLAHLSMQTVRSVDSWDVVRQMFGGQVGLDQTLTRLGNWVATALIDFAPAEGWPAAPGTTLTRDHALRCLAAELLALAPDRLDSAGLLQWTTDAPGQRRFVDLSSTIAEGIIDFLVEVAGPAAVPIMAAVRAGHGVDAIPLGLLASILWPRNGNGVADVELAVARTRLEPRFGGTRLTAVQATAFADAAEAWAYRAAEEPSRREVWKMLRRAEAIAAEIDVTDRLAASALLPSGFAQRLRAFAAAVRFAVPAAGTPLGRPIAPSLVTRAQAAFTALEEHRVANKAQVETARMALRLLRWLSTSDGPAPATLHEALHRQVRQDGWVDRARLDIFAGDPAPEVAEAYRLLYRAADALRTRHDQRFAELLATATAEETAPGALLRVEDVLDRVVAPIVGAGRPVLLLVMDGMSTANATELAEGLVRTGAWLELTPGGGPRSGILAALPTLTRVSRCSLLSGRIAVGEQAEERNAFRSRFPTGELLHKRRLRAGAGAALDADVVAALEDPKIPVVAAVVNTIDDALDRSEPGTAVWDEDTLPAVRDLLARAQDRVVVVVSDHGHVVDRGPEAVVRPGSNGDNRWRPADSPADDGEIVVTGSRVALGGGKAILPWREELRYGPRKAGYHGGASPAEAVIPLLVFTAGDDAAVPGWSGAPVASPHWWREPLPETVDAPGGPVPVEAVPPQKRRSRRPAPQDQVSLFETVPATTVAPAPATSSSPAGATTGKSTSSEQATGAVAAAAVGGPSAGQPELVGRLLASEVYAQRRGTRAPLPDERVAALVGALVAGGGRMNMDSLAATAGIPAHRITSTVTVLRRLLQVEGYPVLTVDKDGVTVILDVKLMTEQFDLGERP